MKVYNSIAAYKKTKPSIVTIGTFDGVHMGHQKILKQLNKTALKNELESILVSFFPHPRMVLQKESSLKLLNTIEERTYMIEKTGISNLEKRSILSFILSISSYTSVITIKTSASFNASETNFIMFSCNL